LVNSATCRSLSIFRRRARAAGFRRVRASSSPCTLLTVRLANWVIEFPRRFGFFVALN
jgi:hypothetical protein